MRVLVTGGAGFIGSHLAETLSLHGHDVTVLDSLSSFLYSRRLKEENISGFSKKGIKFLKLDLLSDPLEEAVINQDVVINEAAIPGLEKSWSHLDVYLSSNVIGLGRLLEATRNVGQLSKFIQISTSSVYGKVATGSEDSALEPYSPYGVSKLAAENLVRSYGYNFGIPHTILRYFSVYGPRQRPDMAYQRFISAISRGEPIVIYGDGSQSRTNTFVTDIVDGTIAAMGAARTSNGKVYNLSGNEEVTLIEAITEIEYQLKKKAIIKFGNARAGDQKITSGDYSQAINDFSYSPKKDFKLGISEQIRWNIERNFIQ
jgi:nucleoside-diphosphate-sugar epimerase